MDGQIDHKIWLQLPIFVVISCVPKQKIIALAHQALSMPDIVITKPYNMHQLE